MGAIDIKNSLRELSTNLRWETQVKISNHIRCDSVNMVQLIRLVKEMENDGKDLIKSPMEIIIMESIIYNIGRPRNSNIQDIKSISIKPIKHSV